MLGKNGSILSPPLILLLFFILTVSSLFVFATSFAKVNIRVEDAGFLDGVYGQEGVINYYIRNTGETAIRNLKSFENPQEVRLNFIYQFKDLFKDYNFKEDYLINLKEQISKSDFEVSVEEGRVLFRVIPELKDEKGGLKITYKPVIQKEFELNKNIYKD